MCETKDTSECIRQHSFTPKLNVISIDVAESSRFSLKV